MKKIIFLLSLAMIGILCTGCVVETTNTTSNYNDTLDTTGTTEITTMTTITATTDSNTTNLPELLFNLNAGIDTIEVNEAFIDAGATATIGNETITVTISSNHVDPTVVGEYQIVYQVTYLGVLYTLTRYVFVIDETAPILELNAGIDTVFIGQDWIDAGATIQDNSGEQIDLIVSGTVNSNVVGQYTITYSATDSSGNTTETIRIVEVYDPS